jgi:hypothetical protein
MITGETVVKALEKSVDLVFIGSVPGRTIMASPKLRGGRVADSSSPSS